MEKRKVGRPPAKDPKGFKITVRLNDELLRMVDDYCALHKAGRTEAIREGIRRLPKK